MLQISPRTLRLTRLAFTVVFIAAFIAFVPWGEGRALLKNVNLMWGVLLFPVLCLSTWLDALRVGSLLSLSGRYRLSNIILTYKTALVAQLPTGVIGGEVYRTVGLSRFDLPGRKAAGALLVCRLLSLSALLLAGAVAACGALLFDAQYVDIYAVSILSAVSVFGFVLSMALVALAKWGGALIPLLPWARVRAWLMPLQDIGRSGFTMACGLSAAIVISKIVTLMILLFATGLDPNPIGATLAIVAGSLLSVLPITVAAIGARETGIAGVLIAQGVPAGGAFSLAILLRVSAAISSALCLAVLLIIARSRHKRETL